MKHATKSNTSLQKRTITIVMENAIDLLVCGKSDAVVATETGVHRTTITRWRLYHPPFIAELNRRRAEVWTNGADRLRAMIPEALEVLASVMANEHSPYRVKAAVEVLKLATPGTAILGPMDPDAVIRSVVDLQRATAERNRPDVFQNASNGVKSYDKHCAEVEAELYAASSDTPETETAQHSQ